jgi:Glycosyl hydrolase family 26
MNNVMLVARPRAAARLAVSIVAALALAASIAAPSAGAAKPSVRAGASATAAPTLHNTCKRSAIEVPSCGVLWGMFMPTLQYPTVEKKVGRRFDIVKDYYDWQPGKTFPSRHLRALAHDGRRILDISWNAIDYRNRAKISYQSIASGQWDNSVILPEARALKSFHHKIFVDFSHEPDSQAQSGRGTPAQYVAAYRHIHRVMAAAGVHNIIWVWVTTGDLDHRKFIKASYPGAAYVNWVGYDPYNWVACHSAGWRTPYQTFAPYYRWVRHQRGMKQKPIMLAEYASAAGPAIGAWYAAVAPALKRLPRIKAVMQWSWMTSSTCDFRLSSYSAALPGFILSSHARNILGKPRG